VGIRCLGFSRRSSLYVEYRKGQIDHGRSECLFDGQYHPIYFPSSGCVLAYPDYRRFEHDSPLERLAHPYDVASDSAGILVLHPKLHVECAISGFLVGCDTLVGRECTADDGSDRVMEHCFFSGL